MAIVVTTPQEISLVDCRRAVNLAKKLDVPIIGVIENMSGLFCPHCGAEIDILGTGGGEKMARQLEVEFLGRIPMEIETRRAADLGKPIVIHHPDSKTATAFGVIARQVENLLALPT